MVLLDASCAQEMDGVSPETLLLSVRLTAHGVRSSSLLRCLPNLHGHADRRHFPRNVRGSFASVMSIEITESVRDSGARIGQD